MFLVRPVVHQTQNSESRIKLFGKDIFYHVFASEAVAEYMYKS